MKSWKKDTWFMILVLALALLCVGGMIHALAAGPSAPAWRFW